MATIISTQKDKRRAIFTLCVLIFLASLLFRLVEMALNPLLSRDAALYLSMAELWHESGDYTAILLPGLEVPPFPIWAIKIIMAQGFGAEVAGRTISLFLGSFLPVAGFLLAWKVSGRIRIAMLAAVLVIVHPELVSYAYQPLRENFYIFFEGLMLVFLVDTIKKDSIWKWGICGVLFSFAFFCRYEILEFMLVIPAVLAFLVFRKKQDLKRTAADVSAFCLFSGLTAVFLLSLIDFNCFFLSRFTDYLVKVFDKFS